MSALNSLKPSERMKIPRQESIEQDARERSANFLEVSFGLDEERAMVEAKRCLECKDPVCTNGCPDSIDIRSFVQKILEKDFVGAVQKIREANYLPAICGRVCPQEEQCESICTMGRKHDPVAIGKLERFVADYEMGHDLFTPPPTPAQRPEKVAIVGSGPSGLTCAAELAKMGYQVTIFEALHAVGGVLRYGIPEFRLPRKILDLETERIKALGVQIHTNFLVGRTATIDELFDEWGFKAVFLGTGAGTPHFMNIPGENYSGVYSANEFLTRVNLMKAYQFPDLKAAWRGACLSHLSPFTGRNAGPPRRSPSCAAGRDRVHAPYRSHQNLLGRQELGSWNRISAHGVGRARSIGTA